MLKTLLVTASLSMALAGAAQAAPKGCPPGLAKKAVPCVPPGQAKKAANPSTGYQRGDVITGDYIIIRDPGRYGLPEGQTYYRVGDNVFRVDRDTREVLDLIGAAAAVLN
ncbi:excinuclease ABC subunit A [uncultured Tateyamaria sp.]|uniref:excinuclease ABC subunit A n=1 Tax=uncultured Tateyamaria sp. TaxID=455651 RepID=UPI00262A877E|nr:excinuclease ABC subunit A [uncultured Tateyamaria sp.]